MIIENLIKLIKEELAASQVNKENLSEEYRLGKTEAYDKIIEEIKKELTK
jgi:RNA-binding protein YhbY